LIVAGIDYSMRSPAVCVYDTTQDFVFDNLKFLAIPCSKKIDGVYRNIEIIQNLGSTKHSMGRFEHLARTFLSYLKSNNVKQVRLEDYSYGSKGRVFHIAENCGLLKYFLYREGIEVELVSPASNKKFATGKGNAKKEQMIEQFEKETGIDLWEFFSIKKLKSIPSPIDDIVDSYFLAKYRKPKV